MYKIGDKVEIIEDDGFTIRSFVGLTGIIVDTKDFNEDVYGIDFNKEFGVDTWKLANSILPKKTGRYYSEENFKLCNDTEVELL